MKLLVLADAGEVARWKRECIELLRDGNDVVVRTAGPPAHGRTAAAFAGIAGGSFLRRTTIVQDSAPIGDIDAVLDLRATPVFDLEVPPRSGHWFFCDGQGRPLGELPGSPEIADGSSTFTIELRSHDSDGRFSLLRSGRFKSLYLYHRSMAVALRECLRWPAISASVHRSLGGSPECRSAGWPQPARRFNALHFAGAILRELWHHIFVNLFTDARWKVGTIEGSPERFLCDDYRPAIRWLPREANDFLADPFVFERGGRNFILGEALDPATRNGFIRCVEFNREGAVIDERPVMQAATHLSYPFTFQHDGVWYLVPESAQERSISLYRAVDAPYRWERVATLIEDVAACDSTIVRRDGRWWLFFTDKARDVNLNLFAYYADNLAGPWLAHAANPVKTDICSARPAGMPFEHEGDLYRPGQDCATAYGNAIAFSRIAKLTPHEYSEDLISTFDSSATGAHTDGTHTISFTRNMVAIDAKQTVWAPPGLIAQRVARLFSRALRSAKLAYAR
ncbi:MAG TPA: hypothetical protein VGK84_12475 [Candidatus Tumulicola sp.]